MNKYHHHHHHHYYYHYYCYYYYFFFFFFLSESNISPSCKFYDFFLYQSTSILASNDSVITIIKGGSKAATISKMERFVIIVNGFQPLTIITKRSILDVAAPLDPPLVINFGYKINFPTNASF